MFLDLGLIFISTLGLIFNGYILAAVLLTRQVTTANNILLLHLGTIDVLLGVLFLVFSAPGASKNNWLTEGVPCSLHGFLYTLLHPLALWTICGLNCDRYYAIAAPLHYTHIVKPRKVLAGLGVGWVISVLLCLPPIFQVAPYRHVEGMEVCAPNFSTGSGGTLWYSTIYTAFTFLLPATLIICSNLKILMIARYHRHRIASAIYEVTLSAQVTITHQRNPFFIPTVTAPGSGGPPKFKGRSAIYTVFQLVGSLAILYLPYYGLITWEATTYSFRIHSYSSFDSAIHENFFKIAMALLTISPPVNGFLYGVRSKQLRKTFQNYWRKKQTKSEVNQEIQARTPSTCGSRRPSLTPLGFLTRPAIQRRLSEALLDIQKATSENSAGKNRIKRIATEGSWIRPGSANSLNLLSSSTNGNAEDRARIKQTSSCNTLQVPSPSGDGDVSTIIDEKRSPNLKLKPANVILQKLFGAHNNEVGNKCEGKILEVNNIATPKRSPRITITRTCSEESDSSRSKVTSSAITKKHSTSSTALFERKWRLLREVEVTTKPLLLDTSSNGSDSSTETTESGKIFMSLDCKSSSNETTELLIWREESGRPNCNRKQSLDNDAEDDNDDVVLH